MTDWKFRPKAEGEIKEDPIQERFFTTTDVGDLTNALIRETIQNSMDARIDKQNKPAIVRLFLSLNSINPELYNPFFSSLFRHLKSENSGLEILPDFSKLMSYLVIDDYNTTGLEGDIYEEDDPPRNDPNKHNFYWFWRNNARSGKGEDDLGRWGVGKTVFSAASDINTFFGLTVRQNDGKKYLMGESVLKWHLLPDNPEWYCPYGFYAKFKNQGAYFALPFDSEADHSVVNIFENSFKIQRVSQENGQDYYGLSIVIPFLKKEIELNGIIKAVIKQYFYPIIEGKLVIDIETNSDEKFNINDETIGEILENVDFEDYIEQNNLKKIFTLAKKSLEINNSNYIKFKDPPLDKAPRWQDSWLFDDEIYKQIDNTRISFENGEIVAFKIPMKIEERGKQPEINWYKAFVQYDGFLKETDSYFIRDGITITGIKTIKKKGLRILIVLDEGNIARMFGDSENPAHTEFQKTAPNFRNKYIDGAACITFLINTISNLYNLLIRPSEGTDDQILKDIFYMEIDLEPKQKEPTPIESGDDEYGKGKVKEINGKISPYLVKRIDAGIVVTDNPKSEKHPSNLTIQLAYMVPRGNPLKKYNKWDFDLNDGSFSIYTEGVFVNNLNENKIDFQINEKVFKISITGFDSERDLLVKVS